MLGRTEENLLKMVTKRMMRNILREERGERREEREADANSDTGSVVKEASQSLLITWNKVGRICTFSAKLSSGLEYFEHLQLVLKHQFS